MHQRHYSGVLYKVQLDQLYMVQLLSMCLSLRQTFLRVLGDGHRQGARSFEHLPRVPEDRCWVSLANKVMSFPLMCHVIVFLQDCTGARTGLLECLGNSFWGWGSGVGQGLALCSCVSPLWSCFWINPPPPQKKKEEEEEVPCSCASGDSLLDLSRIVGGS